MKVFPSVKFDKIVNGNLGSWLYAIYEILNHFIW